MAAIRPAAIYGPDNNIYDMEAPMFLRLLQHRPIIVPNQGLVATSYGHVDDLCSAMVHLSQHPEAFGEVVNVTGNGITSGRYVEELARIVGEDPDVVHVTDEQFASAGRVFGHLFSVRHHAVLDTAKATRLGVVPSFDFVGGHEQTYEWFRDRGFHELTEPLVDHTWNATWDFEAEAALAQRVRGS
ncbi:MAG: NAD-dependent epimerase/dehydratase family protein [Ilumatobacteraceae bacterium]